MGYFTNFLLRTLLVWLVFHHKSFHLSASRYVERNLHLTIMEGEDYRVSAPPSVAELVEFDKNEALLRVAKRIDREAQGQLKLALIAANPLGDYGNGTVESTPPPTVINVTVEILDLNDNPPNFSTQDEEILIPENSPKESRFRLSSVPAVDPDLGENGTIHGYALKGTDSETDQKFKLAIIEGKGLFVEQVGDLDREQRSNYTMVLTAKDGGNPPRTGNSTVHITVVDINDNAPRFVFGGNIGKSNYSTDSFNLTLPSNLFGNATGRALVAKITATDPDEGLNGKVRYRLLGAEDEGDRFSIDGNSGELFLHNPSSWNPYNGHYLFTALRVEALDSGRPPLSTHILLKLLAAEGGRKLDTKPKLVLTSKRVGTSLIDELTTNGTLIWITTAAGFDPGTEVVFKVVKGNENNEFRLDSFGTYCLLRWNKNGTAGSGGNFRELFIEARNAGRRAEIALQISLHGDSTPMLPTSTTHSTWRHLSGSTMSNSSSGHADNFNFNNFTPCTSPHCHGAIDDIATPVSTGRTVFDEKARPDSSREHKSEGLLPLIFTLFTLLLPTLVLLFVAVLLYRKWKAKRRSLKNPWTSARLYPPTSASMNTGISVVTVNDDDYYCTIGGDSRP